MPVVKPSCDLAKKSGIREIGYSYSVSFDVEFDETEKDGAVLFSSEDAKFYLTDPTGGMLGFARDGYLNKFNCRCYPDEKAHITICGNMHDTRLYVNGKHVETLEKQKLFRGLDGKRIMYFLRTLVFPLEKTGEFKSKVTNLKVDNYEIYK